MRVIIASLGVLTVAAVAACGTAPQGASPASPVTNVRVSQPFHLTVLSCGKYTAAQKRQLGTTATGGLTYRYTNLSKTAGAAAASASFLNGTDVATTNTAGSLAQAAPGESAIASIDALGPTGQNVSFRTCRITEYFVQTAQGDQAQRYTP